MYKNPLKLPFFVRDTPLSSLESETCCAYRVLSVILHYLPQRWNNFLHFTCRVKSRQSGDRDELIHKDRWGKKSNMFAKIRDCDPYFDNYEWGCVSALVQLSLSKLNLKLNHVSLSEAFGMIQRTIHRYVVISKLWTSCIS